ncbi:MAG: methylmalonyl-CoA mutase family protein [Desulfatiglans sp.]|jgi:methylmalonyl-CoA mutase N-terminal domain/subunit|nr:methylmalonyl-CoA mutase family protein [Thermodesulfobacteriota bacterium]MEE4354160.1 methylmalonyl-CoA mutase family protein [Desulfatiglans sp.]
MESEKESKSSDPKEYKWDAYLKSYYDKPSSVKSWSGYELKGIFNPDDTKDQDYDHSISDAGTYPFTRGIHPNMFRGRYWTRREVVGIGSPSDTNERLRFCFENGGSGLNTIADVTNEMGLDADHPWAADEVGLTGVNVTSIRDMESLTEGIPLDKVSWSVITATPAAAANMSQYIAVAQNRGYDLSALRGSIQNDPIHARYCGFRPASPLDLSIKLGSDIIEYCSRNLPKWYHTTVNMYDLREQGITAPQEVAFGFGIAMCYIDELIRRGVDIDAFAPRISFYVSCHVDIFEEVSKIRAARRMWAKIMKEKYGAKNPASMHFRFAVHTAGCSLVPQQPLNNIVRISYEALAAVLAGVQSLHCCSYDEPICLPTEKGHLQALRTQQILAYETGVTNVADPLGGSYYVENFTDKIEEESLKIMKQVEELGGMEEAIRTEWLDRELEAAALERQKELDNGDKLVVGVNAFTSSEEKTTPLGVQRVQKQSAIEQIAGVKDLKENRDMHRLKEAIKRLRDDVGEGKNVIPAMVEATKAFGTTGELIGTVREAMGYSYDCMNIIESPFD